MEHERTPFDVTGYVQRTRSGRCFICEFLDGNPEYGHHEVWRDGCCVAFLDRYPTLPGKLLVAPLRHVSSVVGDFAMEEYLDVQRRVYRIGRALTRIVPTERLYIYSLGTAQGNAHVHWHLAALPPGVPYERQQFQALMMENGVIRMDDDEMAALAARIRAELDRQQDHST